MSAPDPDRRGSRPRSVAATDQFVHVEKAPLEQVADPIARREQVRRLLDLDMRREHEDARLRKLVADRLCRYEAFGRVRGRHPNVDDDKLGLVLANEGKEFVRVAGLADHLKTRPLEHAYDALTEKDVIVGHHDPTGFVRGGIDRASFYAVWRATSQPLAPPSQRAAARRQYVPSDGTSHRGVRTHR